MGVFAGIRFLCRAGPMCPAAGYAFFGGARGPRPTGRYVEPRVGDGVPTSRQRGSAALGDGFPRQCAHWLGMTALRADTSLSEGGEEGRIPTPVTAGHTGPALQGAAVIQGGQSRPPLQSRTRTARNGTSYPKGICSAALHGRTPSPTGCMGGGERWGKMFTLAALTLGNYYCIIN